jgi:hypothetical protein
MRRRSSAAFGREPLQVGEALPDGGVEPLEIQVVAEIGVIRRFQADQGRFGRGGRFRRGLAAERQQQARKTRREDAPGGGHLPPRAPRW